MTSNSVGATFVAATTNDVMNAVANVGNIMEGSTLSLVSGVYFQELSFTLANNVRGLTAIGGDGSGMDAEGQGDCAAGDM